MYWISPVYVKNSTFHSRVLWFETVIFQWTRTRTRTEMIGFSSQELELELKWFQELELELNRNDCSCKNRNMPIESEYIGLTFMFLDYRILVPTRLLGYSRILIVASLIYACVTSTSRSQTSAQQHPAMEIILSIIMNNNIEVHRLFIS